MQGVSENKWTIWGHGPPARTQPPPKSPGEEEQALESALDEAMNEIFRNDDEGVAPQSIAEDEDPGPSGLDILGALPDVPPRPTPWGPLAQSYALNDGPPPESALPVLQEVARSGRECRCQCPSRRPDLLRVAVGRLVHGAYLQRPGLAPSILPLAVPHAIGHS